jgi:hypothetical protein
VADEGSASYCVALGFARHSERRRFAAVANLARHIITGARNFGVGGPYMSAYIISDLAIRDAALLCAPPSGTILLHRIKFGPSARRRLRLTNSLSVSTVGYSQFAANPR